MTISLEVALPGSNLLRAAQALGDSETRQVGLLPYAAWDEYAAAGHVLVAVDEGEVVGHVAYRVPRDEVRIAQLVVSPEVRGRGIAHLLVDELRKSHAARRGIGLRCRRDWDANGAWPKLGFTSLGERPGRSAAGSILTEWWLDFGHPDLMSWAPGETETAALMDTNIFLDLHGCAGTDEGATKEVLESLADQLDLVVSPETLNEINRRENPAERQRLTHIASGEYAQLKADPAIVDEWFDRFVSAANISGNFTTQDRSDIRHLAWAAAAGVPIVLTRDERASRRLQSAARTLADITLCHPSILAAVLHERGASAAYAPAALEGTQFETQEITANISLADEFLDNGASERRRSFNDRLHQLSNRRPASSLRLIRDASGVPRALLGTCVEKSGVQVTIARLKSGLLEATLAAHIVGIVRQIATESGLAAMVVSDPLCSERLRKAFRADGFVETRPGLTGLALDARVPRDQLQGLLLSELEALPDSKPLLEAIPHSSPASVLEHVLRPLRLVDADLPTWIVPIRQQWASDLFGHPWMILARDGQLGLGIEHIYYKKGKAGERAPGRVLWYVSRPRSEVFACSHLAEVRDAPAQDLFKRYRRLGVYKLPDVEACERPDGSARALNVTDTELFRRPVSLRRLRELADDHGQSLHIQGACRVSPELFCSIIKEAQDR